jgi:hypothetical protein
MCFKSMNRSQSILVLLTVNCFLILAAGCGKTSAPEVSATARDEMTGTYKQLQIERALAAAQVPCLLFDFEQRKLEVLLQGAIVWDEPMLIDDEWEPQTLIGHMRKPLSNDPVRYIQERHLSDSRKRYADSVLTIIAGILQVDPVLLQRDLPVAFELKTSDGLSFHFEASDDSLQANSKSSLLTGLLSVGDDDPTATIRLPMERALTLYYVAHPGAPLLINLPTRGNPEKSD